MRKIINGLRFLLTPQDKWRMIAITLLLAVGSMLEIVGLGLVMPIVAVFSKPELLEPAENLMHDLIIGIL